MTFNDIATGLMGGIIQTIERITDVGQTYISSDTTRLKEMTATINRVQHRIWHTIFMSCGNWSYDDGNETDLPSAYTDLISGTGKYALPAEALTVKSVRIKDASGIWVVINPLVDNELNQAKEEFYKTSGQPSYYILTGNTCELKPAPNYNSTGGLKFEFDRDSVDFVYTATTATPGFASPYHELIPVMASIEWLKIKQPGSPTLPILIQDQIRVEKSMKDFYAKRFKNKVPRIGRAASQPFK